MYESPLITGGRVSAVASTMAEGDTWERFMTSLGVLLEQVGHPGVQQNVHVDGPAVLD